MAMLDYEGSARLLSTAAINAGGFIVRAYLFFEWAIGERTA